MGKDLTGKELGKGLSQRKDGLYSARFYNRFGVRKELYGHNLAELKRELKLAVKEDAAEKNVEKNYSLNNWFDVWLKEYKTNIRDTTKRGYSCMYYTCVADTLGKMQLNSIKQIDVQRLLNRMADSGKSSGSLSFVRSMLMNMFRIAYQNDFVSKNPVSGVVVGGRDPKKVVALTLQEQQEFLEASKGSFYEDAFFVQLNTGLRSGELFALNPWKDIDFRRNEIHVRHTLVFMSKEGYKLNKPKTKNSSRVIPFDDRVAAALKRQMKRKEELDAKHPPKFDGDLASLIFVTTANGLLNMTTYNTAISKVISKINKARGPHNQFPHFSGHSLRHTFATRCFEAGLPAKTVQALMGHSTIAITMNRYTHITDDKLTLDTAAFHEYMASLPEKDVQKSNVTSIIRAAL